MKQINFTIQFESEPYCVGVPVSKPESVVIGVFFTDDEIATMKELIKASSVDKEAGLMPILEASPHLLYKVDSAAQAIIRDYYKHEEEETLSVFLGEEGDFEEICSVDEEEVAELYNYICLIPDTLL